VYHPESDELWTGGRTGDDAQRHAGAPLVDQPLRSCPWRATCNPTRLPDDGVREPLLRVLREAATVRMLGSGSIELSSVAGGRLGAWCSTTPWTGTGCPARRWCVRPAGDQRDGSAGTLAHRRSHQVVTRSPHC